MYIAKYGVISMSGHVAKLAAGHDFRSYVENLAFLQKAHKSVGKSQAEDQTASGQELPSISGFQE